LVNPIIKFGIPIVGIIVVGLALREASATSLGSAGGSLGGFGGGIGSAFSGVAKGLGDVPRQVLGGFGEGLGSLSSGIKSFTSIFGIGNEPIPPAVESGATNPSITQRFTSNPVQEVTGSTTGSSNFSALSYRQAQGF
tara:strand:+ start:986 stop:1399 length:414 start_codon:yes stop_codon:yes gene_type:complete